MKFEEAIAWMKRGEKIKRGHWKSYYIFASEDKKILMTNGYKKSWYYAIKRDDVFSNDWKISTNNAFDEEE